MIETIISRGLRKYLPLSRQLATKMRIEVEKKFKIPENIETRLTTLNASLLKEESFCDVYHDTAGLDLSRRDHWLRRRDLTWELKSPHRNYSRLESTTCKYEEFVGKEEIVEKLAMVLGRDVELSEMVETAKFTTQRKTYQIIDALIVLDRADFGHAVGEIEIMVDREEDVACAESRLLEIAKQLGCHGDQWTPGKVESFLMTYRPEHYQSLIDASVFRKQ